MSDESHFRYKQLNLYIIKKKIKKKKKKKSININGTFAGIFCGDHTIKTICNVFILMSTQYAVMQLIIKIVVGHYALQNNQTKQYVW